MAIQDWLDEDDEKAEQQLKDAHERAQQRSTIKNLIARSEIGEVSKPLIIWLVTKKMGQRLVHRFHLPNGNFRMVNCVATPAQQENSIQICPVCAYVAGGGGEGRFGEPNMEEQYYFIGIVGDTTAVMMKNEKTGELEPSDYVIWRHEAQAIPATQGMMRGFVQWMGNKDFPPGCEGNITAYAFRVHKFLKEGGNKANKKDWRYKVDYYPGVKQRPTTTFHPETKAKVEIDLEVARTIYDQIVQECKPGRAETLKAMIEGGRGPAGTSSADGGEHSATPLPIDVDPAEPAARASAAHDFDDEAPAKPAATTAKAKRAIKDDENF